MTSNRFLIPLLTALAAAALAVAAEASSTGGVGGTATGGGGGGQATNVSPGCSPAELGRRTLRLGDCGEDVRTLNWILRAKPYGGEVTLAERFEDPTEATVRAFERRSDLRVDGVVDGGTTEALVGSMPRQLATWYGPGFFGNQTACGQTLKRRTVGVAHRSLPCGTRVVVRYGGEFLRTRVIDRGPFAHGARWDLTQGAARLVGFTYTDEIRVAALAKR